MGARAFAQATKPKKDERVWSEQQQAIFDWFEHPEDLEIERAVFDKNAAQNLVVRARAGTGKTTTIIEGVNRAPESSILVCAFNKRIAEELNFRITNGAAVAKTLHAVGYAAIRREWPGIGVGQGVLSRGDDLTNKACSDSVPKQIKRLVTQLHTKAREMAITPTHVALVELALFFDIMPDEGWEGQGFDVEYLAERAIVAVNHAATKPPNMGIGIDFADMIYLPLAWNLLQKEYDLIVVDEAQDLSAAQLTIAQRLCSGRICVVGDDRQCQPAGTMVRSSISGNVPIESLKMGDAIESFDRHGQVFIRSGRVTNVAVRHYTGSLIKVSAAGNSSRCTPSHKWLVRWTNKAQRPWITYLMRQGARYRVGECQLFYGGGLFGLSARARTEEADAAWILDVHATREEALAYEQILSVRFGLPEMIFRPASGIKYFTQAVIDTVYDSFDPETQQASAHRCLQDHGRDLHYPIYEKAITRRGRTTIFETQACNLVSGFMSVALAPSTIPSHDKKDRHAVSWVPIRVTSESFVGPVYSLDIERYHKYVADGLVTCNSIYAWRGADSGSIDRLKAELGAGELPLTLTYRCAQAVTRRAQQFVPDIQAGKDNPEGIVDAGHYDQLLDQAEPGQFVLSRLNAPLVSITLQFLRRKKRARMAGRDIGAGIQAILKKIGLYGQVSSIEDMLSKLDTWEIKTCSKLAAYGQLALIDRCHDQAGMLRALAEESNDTADLVNRIQWLFTDSPEADMILCSSVHKAKGLEAERVWMLQESLYRRGWTKEEENIDYVATTRAKSHLTLVSRVPGMGIRR
jgi:hypothetical protein